MVVKGAVLYEMIGTDSDEDIPGDSSDDSSDDSGGDSSGDSL